MTNAGRRRLPPSASVGIPASRAKKALGTLRTAGAVVCLLAIFFSAGGHWAVLQSIAYTGMLIEFAQKYSLCAAVQKTFDDRYACPLCPKIRDGYNKERETPPSLSGSDRLPEITTQFGDHFIFVPIEIAEVIFVPGQPTDFSTTPPTPPPRGLDCSNQKPSVGGHELRLIAS